MKNNKIAEKIKVFPNNKILWEAFPRILGHKYIITSAKEAPFTGAETYMFGSDENGNIIDWNELPGSYTGGLEHSKCFEILGYSTNE